ncbi:S-adenosyl-L-homocysteine hydrolase [Parafrankia sp. EAN1pec]|uniref:adenosylhomocysteinase n=1 Tax=Parafrankia sp. (strain EAN1pec) TaxID=298653 RepID=UPI00015D9CC9|nr:S-adenosyl-L-homocysteine hydrolase [Frankia sp. EAN1pec]
MFDLEEGSRRDFLWDVLALFGEGGGTRILVITHCLTDRPVFLQTLNKSYPISQIHPIPYSENQAIVRQLEKDFRVTRLSLAQLLDAKSLLDRTSELIEEESTPLAIVEIGGYHASLVGTLKERHGKKFMGCVESTEHGHRAYERQEALSVPVVSVARSRLKDLESQLIGPSVAFSVEKLVRAMGVPLFGLNAGILGYGRVGRNLAYSLAGRGSSVSVYDSDPLRRISAAADGFQSVSRESVVQTSDIIVGATGNTSLVEMDFPQLKHRVILASATSKRAEFALEALLATADHIRRVNDGVDEITMPDGRRIYVLTDGEPVNFADGAVVGPVMSLVHAEIIAALSMLWRSRDSKGIHNVEPADQEKICHLWVERFLNS